MTVVTIKGAFGQKRNGARYKAMAEWIVEHWDAPGYLFQCAYNLKPINFDDISAQIKRTKPDDSLFSWGFIITCPSEEDAVWLKLKFD